MRVRRIRLRNYRGVADRDIQLEPSGVTVIEGPNEIGKSSLAEALSLVFEQLDSTKRREVQLVQPVDHDVGPEVEVEIETGPYRFTYFKRFLKRPETTLRVTAPRPENYTGREAHDRANAILDESMDVDLWKALCVVQGSAIEQTNLTNITSFAEALDRAAGHEVAGEREVSIFEAAHREYKIYFTDTARETGVLKESREAVEHALQTEEAVREDLEGIDELVTRSTVRKREIKSLEEQAADAEKRAEQREAEQKQVEEQETLVGQLERAWEQMAEQEARIETDLAVRKALVQKVEGAEIRVQEFRTELENDKPSLKKAEQVALQLAEETKRAEQTVKETKKDAELRRADNEYHRAKLDLDQLTERRQRIEAAQRKAREADDFLEVTKVTGELLEHIKRTSSKYERAQAQLDAGSPRLLVTALKDLKIEVNKESRSLAQGESLDESVGEATRLRVPDVIEFEVWAGTSLDTLVRTRDSHQKALKELLDSAGVSSQEEAEKTNLARMDAERAVEDSQRIIEENLRDLSIDEMDAKIERLKTRVSSYPNGRADDPVLPEDFDSSSNLKNEAEKHYEQVQAAARVIGVNHDVAKQHYDELKERSQEANVELRVAVAELENSQTELDTARQHVGDETLAEKLQQAQRVQKAAEQGFRAAQGTLASQNPEQTRVLAENARRAASRTAQDLRQKQDEQQRILANLELLGEKGLYDAHEEACTVLEHAQSRFTRGEARAAAASLLFQTLNNKREVARRAYAAPLREKVGNLGRYVYDSSFSVEFDENLCVSSRTLAGITLPFDSLSIGAKEQLSIMVRLACSLLIDESEGVPLIFDDTLGHTDPERLEGMGAMLSLAGLHCQIVVLTCTPGRFSHIGDANVLSFADATSTPDDAC